MSADTMELYNVDQEGDDENTLEEKRWRREQIAKMLAWSQNIRLVTQNSAPLSIRPDFDRAVNDDSLGFFGKNY